jgi:uncharacterized protein YodC (DUF2158 family)
VSLNFHELKAGDKIMHIAGGPVMIVMSKSDGPTQSVLCCWFDKNHTRHEEEFKFVDLVEKPPLSVVVGYSR